MKRIISLAVVLLMAFTLCACGGGGSSSQGGGSQATSGGAGGDVNAVAQGGTQATTGAAASIELPDDLPALKIGAVGAYSGNELYVQWRKNLESLAEPFNIEFQFVEPGVGEDYMSAVESLVTAGVDAIITQMASEPLVQYCSERGVAYMIYCNIYSDELMQAMAQYDGFCGNLTEDDIATARHGAEAMYEAGCRNVAIVGLTRGTADMFDNRADYFKERFEELGGNIIAEDYSMLEFSKSISTFAAAHPDMDGIWGTLLNESVFQAIVTEGLVGSIKLGGFDVSDSTPEFFDNGTLVFACTGQQATIVASFAALYNYLYDGTYLIEDRGSIVYRSFIEIHNSEEYAEYDKYVRYSTCYSPEEIAYMIKGINPDYTFEDYAALNQAFSLDDVIERTVG